MKGYRWSKLQAGLRAMGRGGTKIFPCIFSISAIGPPGLPPIMTIGGSEEISFYRFFVKKGQALV